MSNFPIIWPHSADASRGEFRREWITSYLTERNWNGRGVLYYDANGTVMLRMPLHPVAIELLRAVGPMAVSSANISGRPAAVTADQARDQLGDLVDVYLDGGPAEQQSASTIVDLTGAHPRVLRQGPVTVEAIASVLGVDAESLTDDPGQPADQA